MRWGGVVRRPSGSAAWWVACALCCGGQSTDRGALERPWFASCRVDADCAQGSCLCGICSRACEAAASCSGVSRGLGSVCAEPGSELQATYCAGRGSAGLCLPRCEWPSDCGGGPCLSGVCAPAELWESLVERDRGGQVASPARESLCATSPRLWRSVQLGSQAEVDAMIGCEVVQGNLWISLPRGTDRSALRSLREVVGTLSLAGKAWSGPGAELVTDSLPSDSLPPDGLGGLSSLQRVGSLVIDDCRLTSLAGLGALQRVGSAEEKSGTLSIVGCPWLAGLEGLDSLEEVGVFELRANPTLSSFAGAPRLARIGELRLAWGNDELPGAPGLRASVETVHVSESPLDDLSGLAELAGVRELSISGRELASLRGLPSSSEIAELHVSGSPLLRDLSGLEELDSLTSLSLSYLDGLTSLEGLSPSASLTRVYLSALPSLPAVRRLPMGQSVERVEVRDTGAASIELGSGSVDRLLVTHNEQLTSLAGLASLSSLRVLFAQRNPALASLGDLAALGLEGVLLQDDDALPSLAGLPTQGLLELRLTGNQALTADDAYFGSVQSLRALSLVDTDLLEISLPSLSRCHLRIERNKRLQRISAPALEAGADTSVEALFNPQLDDASLDALRPFAGPSLVLSWSELRSTCPWENDGECDEPSGLCTAGTDPADCRGLP